MPGARLRSFRLGDRSELLVQHLLTGLAFTTPVPRQEDIGFDFLCSLITQTKDSGLLRARPFFTVQAKSKGAQEMRKRSDKSNSTKWTGSTSRKTRC